MKSVFLNLREYDKRQSLAVKTTYFIDYVSYLNLEGEGSSCKISRFMSNLSYSSYEETDLEIEIVIQIYVLGLIWRKKICYLLWVAHDS